MSDNKLKNRDIVILGLQQWEVDAGCSNAKYIASTLAQFGNRVLFVNTPLDRATWIRGGDSISAQKKLEVLKNNHEQFEQVEPNLWNYYPKIVLESINWISNPTVFNALNRFNNKRFACEILKAIKKLDFKDIILINDNDLFKCFYLKEYLAPAMSVFYIRDFLTGVDYWKKHGGRLEPELLKKSDLVIANSPFYAEYAKRYNPYSFFVGQGCDLRLFNSDLYKEIPKDIRKIKKPIIGYVGALKSLRLDIEIIAHVAKERPDWNIVLVGSEDDDFKKSKLHQMDNVHFLGQKEMDVLPAYIKYFDVCINPQVVNEVTIGNYPLKIDEYLAMGKPVIATRTKTMHFFEPHVYLAENVENYVELIEKAMIEDDLVRAKERKKFAASHSWDNNVIEICKAVQKTLDAKDQIKVLEGLKRRMSA